MGLSGAEAAEEVGASIGKGAAQGQEQSDHSAPFYHWNDHSVQQNDRTWFTRMTGRCVWMTDGKVR
jgi:hypothetical protein